MYTGARFTIPTPALLAKVVDLRVARRRLSVAVQLPVLSIAGAAPMASVPCPPPPSASSIRADTASFPAGPTRAACNRCRPRANGARAGARGVAGGAAGADKRIRAAAAFPAGTVRSIVDAPLNGA
jgi:hypothetical protein